MRAKTVVTQKDMARAGSKVRRAHKTPKDAALLPTDVEPKTVAQKLKGSKQAVAIDSLLNAGVFNPETAARTLVLAGLAKDEGNAISRIKRHLKTDKPGRVAKRNLVVLV